MTRRVLFLCTGNFYRSRFAEAVFNHRATALGLPWSAFSRGLAAHMAQGTLSPLAAEALASRSIDLRHTGPERVQLGQEDLEGADLCIALKDAEHRPLVVKQFPYWEERVLFWNVSDIDFTPADEALPQIERHVLELIGVLREDPEAPLSTIVERLQTDGERPESL